MVGLRTIAGRFGWAVVVGAVALSMAASAAASKSAKKAKPEEPLPAVLDFVGTWAATAAACKEPESTIRGPNVFGPKTYDQFETHCKLWGVKTNAGLWTANATCSVEGDKQRHSLMMKVTGDAMDLGWDSPGGQKLVRCK